MDKILLFYVCINLWGSQNISNNDEDIRIYVYGAKTRSTLEREYHINFEGDENYLLFWLVQRQYLHMHAIIEGHADQNQRSTDKREGNLNYKEGTGKTLRKSFIC